MCSGLQDDETSRYPLKCLLHPFRCRCHFLFQKDFARFIQNAVERPAIAEVQTNRELVSFENHVSIYPNSASLFHSRSPFLCASRTSNIGSVPHPAGDGPSHLICHKAAMNAGATSNKEPSLRPEWRADYFAANIGDPDGYNIEIAYKPWLSK